jgi:hypothetical protein
LQGGDFRRVHKVILADDSDGFQRHVTACDRPFVVLLKHQRAGKTTDGGLIRKDPHHIGSALDLFVQAFKRIGGVDLPPASLRESLAGQHVILGAEHQFGKLGVARLEDLDQLGPLVLGVCQRVLIKGRKRRAVTDTLELTVVTQVRPPLALPSMSSHHRSVGARQTSEETPLQLLAKRWTKGGMTHCRHISRY